MKKSRIPHLSIFLTIFSVVCGVQTLKAQDTPAGIGQNESIKFTGSPVKAENIVSTCDAVFVGEITDAGNPSNPSADGWTVYSGIAVKVSNIFRGSVDSQIDVSLRTLSTPSTHESPPLYEHAYIFFVNKSTDASVDPYIVLKLLPATDNNITMVRKLLAKNSGQN